MSSTFGAMLLTVSLSGAVADGDKLMLPQPILEAGLRQAHCTIPPNEAAILGTERLGSRLEIVEVSCWRTGTNTGSILFAIPERRPQSAQLLTIERWENGRIRQGHSVASPGFDPHTRTLSSTIKAREDGDCGTIQEMKWTGWHFRLLNVWSKPQCDGDAFDWDSREKWQVFPRRGRQPDSEESTSGHEDGESTISLR